MPSAPATPLHVAAFVSALSNAETVKQVEGLRRRFDEHRAILSRDDCRLIEESLAKQLTIIETNASRDA